MMRFNKPPSTSLENKEQPRKLYHVFKRKDALVDFLKTKQLKPGKNLSDNKHYAHLMTELPQPGDWALDVIGADTNEAWVVEVFVDNDIELKPDPSGESKYYGGGEWLVFDENTPLKVSGIGNIAHIENVQKWEMGRAFAKILTESEIRQITNEN